MSKVDRNLHGDSQVDFAIAIYVAYLILDSLSNENQNKFMLNKHSMEQNLKLTKNHILFNFSRKHLMLEKILNFTTYNTD